MLYSHKNVSIIYQSSCSSSSLWWCYFLIKGGSISFVAQFMFYYLLSNFRALKLSFVEYKFEAQNFWNQVSKSGALCRLEYFQKLNSYTYSFTNKIVFYRSLMNVTSSRRWMKDWELRYCSIAARLTLSKCVLIKTQFTLYKRSIFCWSLLPMCNILKKMKDNRKYRTPIDLSGETITILACKRQKWKGEEYFSSTEGWRWELFYSEHFSL